MAQRITPRATKTTSSSRRLPQKSPDSSRYGGGISSRAIGEGSMFITTKDGTRIIFAALHFL
jgi:hypothetical protein